MDNSSNNLSKDPPYFASKFPYVTKIFKNRIEEAIDLASITNDSNVLDVGCFNQYLLKMIRKKSSATLHGVDLDTGAISNPYLDCDLRIADARNLPFRNEEFDIIFTMDTLEHIDKIDIAIKEIYRCLKKDGVAILSGPTESWFYRFCRFLWLRRITAGYHIHTIYEIEKVFESNGFQLVELRTLPSKPLPELFRITKFKKIT